MADIKLEAAQSDEQMINSSSEEVRVPFKNDVGAVTKYL